MKSLLKPLKRTMASVVVATVITQSVVAPALAQAAGQTSSASDHERARVLLEQGLRQIDASDYEAARATLAEAWSLARSYDIAGALGQSELELGRFRDAAEHLEYSVRHFPPGENRELLQTLQEALTSAKRHVGSVQVKVNRRVVELRIDDVPVDSVPPPPVVFVEPGSHTIEARDPDNAALRASETVDATAGSEHSIDLILPSASTDSSASLSASSTAGQETGSDKSLIPVYVGIGVTAVSLAAWVGFGLAASSDREEADAFRSQLGPAGCANGSASDRDCAAAREAYSDQRRNATISNVGLGVGIAAGVATLSYLLFWPSDSSSSSTGASVRPVAAFDPSGASVAVTGAF